MKYKFLKKHLIIDSTLLIVAASLTLSCNNPSAAKPTSPLTPHYLLTGTLSGSSGYLDYYDIGNDEYAVAINDTFVSGSAINILNQYNNKPVTGIMHDAFYNISASSITIPNGIKTIDFEAFLYCDVETLIIPYTVNRIGDGAFYSSTVEHVTFVNSNAEDAGSACLCDTPPVLNESVIPSTLTKIPSFCFFNCKSLQTISLPASIEEIGEEAFNGCSSLSSTLAFQSITTIREKAFQGCTSLRKIHISKSMFENASGVGIEPHAFNYCTDKSVLEFYFYGTNAKINAWLTNHTNWGWFNDRGNPATDTYTIKKRIDGAAYFTSDWTYTVANGEATITGYNGPAPTNGYISIPDYMPKPEGTKVTKIEADVFDEIKGSIERLYLPTTLVEIGNGMFKKGFDKLYVVDDNTACARDHANPPATGRINLSGLDDLKYIGSHAFAFRDTKSNPNVNYGIGAGTNPATGKLYKELITKLYLPAHLIAVGDEAFGVFGQSMLPNVTDFRWEYDSESVLETVGADCFFALGIPDANGDIKSSNIKPWVSHPTSTLIFPKTFRHFGLTTKDKTDYNDSTKYDRTFNFNLGGEEPIKGERPAHAFEACSLIKKVVFKGGANSNDLIIPLQTFVYNEFLETVIFEERPGKYIAFHTQVGDDYAGTKHYGQESIGGNGGRDKLDFRGEPFLQNLFLPNKTTNLFIQNFAFHANSRAKIYLSDTYGHNMYSDGTRYTWTEMITGNYSFSTTYGVDDSSKGAKQWRTIGDETYYNIGQTKRYYGYCFTSDTTANNSNTDSLNTFSLDQKMPYYENIHYAETIEEDYIESTEVEFGENNPNEFVIENKCSYVCKTDTTRPSGKQNVAIMTNYLFNLRDGSSSEDLRTCTILKTISVNNVDYSVIEIGESAFSSCFCNGEDTSPKVAISSVDNVRYIKMPDTIEKIGDYAFIRSYAVEKISSYEDDPASATERMPKALEHIGKNAFIFSGIKKVLKIPFACKFYENETDNYKITSVFANALSLRRITFIDYNSATPEELDYSDYYEATTYTSSNGSTYTSALYSTNNAALSYKKNRLLLVLNRDKNDRKKESEDHNGTKDCEEYGNPVEGVTFNGLNKTNPFLYGAYKMGYWIKEIVWNNNATTNKENNTGTIYAQALFSAVGKYSSNEFVDDYIFLGEKRNLYSTLDCYLKSVTGITNITKLPKYGFDGCEQLVQVNLPNQSSAIPDGVFANGNTAVNYITVTPASPHGADSGYLDLTGTGYTAVGKETFKNNPSITHFIAPSVATFTVGVGAFQSCANLTNVDFSNVTGKLIINASAFASSGVTNIIWPTDPNCKIVIVDGSTNSGAFSNCNSLVSVSLPANLFSNTNATTKTLGKYAFSGCTNLTTVTGTADSVDITTIGDGAFNGCSKLDNFDFGIFTSSLTTIGASAFTSCKTITNNGNISLPSTITSIGSSAFKSSKIVTMTINTTSEISIGANAFESCTALTAFRFADAAKGCTWKSYSNAVFNSCTNLVELQLPSPFVLTTNFGNVNFIKGDTNIKIYSYAVYNNQSAHESWRKTATGQVKPVHYLVTSKSDLLTGSVISESDHSNIKGTIYFWTADSSGHAVFLGKIKSYDGTTVTFQDDNGNVTYTLAGSTFSPAIP